MDRTPGQWTRLLSAQEEPFCFSHILRIGEKSQGDGSLPTFCQNTLMHSYTSMWHTHSCTHMCPPQSLILTHTHIHTFTYTPDTHTFMQSHMPTHAFTRTHRCPRAPVHTLPYVHTCTHSHTYTLTNASTHYTVTYARPPPNAWKEMWKQNRHKRSYIQNLIWTIVENLERFKWRWKSSIKWTQ